MKKNIQQNNTLSISIMNSEALMEKMMRIHLAPEEMFRKHTHLYSAFDARGIPTHDASGNELHKSQLKKLTKDWEKQYKLYYSRPLDD